MLSVRVVVVLTLVIVDCCDCHLNKSSLSDEGDLSDHRHHHHVNSVRSERWTMLVIVSLDDHDDEWSVVVVAMINDEYWSETQMPIYENGDRSA